MNVLGEKQDFNLNHATILIVDDQPINIQIIDKILSSQYKIIAATSGDQAIEACQRNPPDLILLDVVMPNMSGVETCAILKQRVSTAEIPVIFVTSCEDQKEEDDCWVNGGVDFINKPINPTTLRNRVKAHLTLKHQRDMLDKLVYIDYLTSIYNKRYFDEHILRAEACANREKQDMALLLVDIDFFDAFNKEYGDIRGDKALKEAALSIQNSIMRPADFVARLGGIFAVVLPNTDLAGALNVAIKVKRAVFANQIPHPHSPYKYLSVSIGLSTVFTAQDNMKPLIEHAEHYLNEAKDSGRHICKHPKLS